MDDALRALEQRGQPRDRALLALALFAGLRVGELVALDVDDVATSARKGNVVVRRGKGDRHREVPLNAEARTALEAWAKDRNGWAGHDSTALFLSRAGGRLSGRAVGQIVDQVSAAASPSPPTSAAHLLHQLVRGGHDLVLVAELAGHRNLETTRRYSLPTAEDSQAAVETLNVDY